MLRQLTELQQWKQDTVGELQQMNLKYDTTQREVLEMTSIISAAINAS